jgi:hypothetical protein
MRRIGLLVVGLAVLASVPVFAAKGAAASGSGKVVCHSGDIIEGQVGSVIVPSGNFCELLRATVEGSVTAESGAIQLGIDDSTIVRNVVSEGTTDNGWLCGSTVDGNVTVVHSALNSDANTGNSPGDWAIGDPSWCIPQFDPQPGNVVYGKVLFSDNQSGATITDNDLEGSLICERNTPEPTGSDNSVDGDTTAQCAGLGGTPDTDANSPPDRD